MLTCFLLFLAGLGASIGTVVSIVTNVKNFDDKVSTLLVAIMITYMKMAPGFDIALKEGFFPEADDRTYLIIIGVFSTLVLVLGMFTMRKVECGKIIDAVSKEADPMGVFVYIGVTGLYLFVYWTLVRLFNLYTAGVPTIIAFLFINFLCLGLAIFIIYMKVKSGGGVGLGAITGALKKKKENKLGDMVGMTKYWCLLVAGMMVIGAGYSYQEQSVALAAEAGAIGAIDLAGDVFWLTDALGRFGGGTLAYFLVEKVNGYIFAICWAACSLIGNICIFFIVGLDIDSAALIVIAAFWQGFGIGGMWVVIPQILIDDAGDDDFGKIYGLSILFAYIGMFVFDWLIFMLGLAMVVSIIFIVMGIVACVCTFLGWKDDEKKK